MFQEEILRIIKSSKDETTIADSIISKIAHNKSLLGPFFEYDRNLFHILVLNNLNGVIQLLLKNKKLSKELIKSLKGRDIFGNNVLHLCVIGEVENLGLLCDLIKWHPDGIYETNLDNRTPVEEAFLSKKVWAQAWAISMQPKEILNILDEIKDQGIIAELIEKKIATDRNYLNPIFEHNQTIFHILVSHNLNSVIKILLETKNKKLLKPLRESLRAQDSNKNNVLHFCVLGQEENPELLQYLMRVCPDAIHEANNSNRTPGEEAFHNGKAWALELISKPKSLGVERLKEPLEHVYNLLHQNGFPLKIKVTHNFEDNCKRLADKLKPILQKHEHLTGPIFSFGRNFFHIFAQNNLFIVINELLKDVYLAKYAKRCDEHENTILHHCIEAEGDCTPLLELLIEKFPNLINTPNNIGNTPLHQAVLCNNHRAVETLLKKSAIATLVNTERKSPLDIAHESADIKNLRIRLMLEIPDAFEKINTIFNEFPQLTAGNEDQESDLSKITSIKKSRSMSSSVKTTLPTEDDEKILHLKSLSSIAYPGKIIAFANHCQKTVLDIPEKFIKKRSTDKRIYKVLIDTLNQLRPAAQSLYTSHYEQYEDLLAELNHLLFENGLVTNPEPVSFPELMEKAPFKTSQMKLIWRLTACMLDDSTAPKFDNAEVLKFTLGLLNRTPANNLIQIINFLYPYFNLNQKLVANFIIIQIVHLNNTVNFFDLDISNEVDEFLQHNQGLEQLGLKLNSCFDKLIELNARFNSTPLIFNYKLLDKSLGTFQSIQKQDSFDQLIKMALSSKNEERTLLMGLAIKEIRIWTINFFQRLQPKDFVSNGAFEEIVKAKGSLSNYFSNLVLEQPDEKVTETLAFISELIPLVFSFNNHSIIDLNLLSLLTNIFNTSAISRLKVYLEQLPEEKKNLIDEYIKLISPSKNNQYLLLLQTLFPLRTLLDPAAIRKELLFQEDGNRDNMLWFIQMLGNIMFKTIPSRRIAQYEPAHFSTDLPYLLNSPCAEDIDDHLYTKSLRLAPAADSMIDIDLDGNKDTTEQVIEKISSDYLKNKTIPVLKYQDKYSSKSMVIRVLIQWYSSLENEEERQLTLQKFTDTVNLFIHVHNNYYYPSKSDTFLNPLYFNELAKKGFKEMHRIPNKESSFLAKPSAKFSSIRLRKAPGSPERESLQSPKEVSRGSNSPHGFFTDPISRKKTTRTRPRSVSDPIPGERGGYKL